MPSRRVTSNLEWGLMVAIFAAHHVAYYLFRSEYFATWWSETPQVLYESLVLADFGLAAMLVALNVRWNRTWLWIGLAGIVFFPWWEAQPAIVDIFQRRAMLAFVIFYLVAIVCVALVVRWRGLQMRRKVAASAPSPPIRWRFSIAGILIVTTLVAVVTRTMLLLPEMDGDWDSFKNWFGWFSAMALAVTVAWVAAFAALGPKRVVWRLLTVACAVPLLTFAFWYLIWPDYVKEAGVTLTTGESAEFPTFLLDPDYDWSQLTDDLGTLLTFEIWICSYCAIIVATLLPLRWCDFRLCRPSVATKTSPLSPLIFQPASIQPAPTQQISTQLAPISQAPTQQAQPCLTTE